MLILLFSPFSSAKEPVSDKTTQDSALNTKKEQPRASYLDPELKSEVLELLTKVQQQDATFVEFKEAEITVDGNETEMYLVKTKNGDNSMHIEIDIEGR